MNKQKLIQRNKRYSNLPRFNNGTVPINPGYQAATNWQSVTGIDTPAANGNTLVSGQKQQNIQSGILGATSLASAFPSLLEAEKAPMFVKNAAGKNVFNFAGKGAGILQTLKGGYDLAKTIDGWNDNLGTGDFQDMSAKQTESIGGVSYNTLGGYDVNAVNKYTKAQNTGAKTDAALAGMSIGAGVGSLFPGLGTVIGAGVGAVAGFALDPIFGWSKRRKERVEREQNNFAVTSDAYNEQNYSEAASQAMRNQFSADEGKSPTYTPNGTGDLPVNAKVGKGETLYNAQEGTATVVDRGVKRKDDQDAFLKPSDAVLGNLVDPTTGMTYAQQAEPYARKIEYLNSIQLKGDKNTQQIQQREINKAKEQNLAQLDMITERQKLHHMSTYKCGKSPNYKCGKSPKYDTGLSSYLSVLPGLAETLVGIKQSASYKKDPIQYYNSYVPDYNGARALDILSKLRYNPYNELNNINDQSRQALYSIIANPYAMSQRMALQNAVNTNALKAKGDLASKTQQMNNQYDQVYADALMKYGQSETARKQTALQQMYDDYAKAKAAKRRGIETGWNTTLKGIDKAVGNYLNNLWTGENIKLWRDDQKIENQKLGLGQNTKPTSTSSFNYNSPRQKILNTLDMNNVDKYPTADDGSGYFDWSTLPFKYPVATRPSYALLGGYDYSDPYYSPNKPLPSPEEYLTFLNQYKK